MLQHEAEGLNRNRRPPAEAKITSQVHSFRETLRPTRQVQQPARGRPLALDPRRSGLGCHQLATEPRGEQFGMFALREAAHLVVLTVAAKPMTAHADRSIARYRTPASPSPRRRRQKTAPLPDGATRDPRLTSITPPSGRPIAPSAAVASDWDRWYHNKNN